MGARAIYIFVSAILSIYLAYGWGELLALSDSTLNGILAVFSILAAVLIAVISIIGDPSMLLSGNWRIAYEHTKEVQKNIARFSHLFLIYIISLALVLACFFIKESKVMDPTWVYRFLFGFSTFGLLLSIPLPYTLMSIQRQRLEQEIKDRKARSVGELRNKAE